MAAPARTKRAPVKRTAVPMDVAAVLAWLEAHASRKVRDEMGPRYGIHTDRAYGVAMRDMLMLARTIGRDHALAAALWDTGRYEARMVAAMVEEPAQVTAAQMDRWCKDFDNWGIVDTVCFKLFDRLPPAFTKVRQWAKRRSEFEKRAAFVLLACLALHDRAAEEEDFLVCLPLVEDAADDDRNFVRKGVSWAMRAMAGRGPRVHREVHALAGRLAASTDPARRWLGKDVLRQIGRAPH